MVGVSLCLGSGSLKDQIPGVSSLGWAGRDGTATAKVDVVGGGGTEAENIMKAH